MRSSHCAARRARRRQLWRRSLTAGNLLDLTQQHLTISLIATALTCLIAIPLGIALTRGPMRRYSKPIITVAATMIG